MKRPRRIKKRMKNNGTLIYDLATIPNGKSLGDIVNEFHYRGIVVWSSSAATNLGRIASSNAPTVINGIKKIKIINLP